MNKAKLEAISIFFSSSRLKVVKFFQVSQVSSLTMLCIDGWIGSDPLLIPIKSPQYKVQMARKESVQNKFQIRHKAVVEASEE